MQNPNAIVSAVARITPPLDRPADEVLRISEGRLTVEFENQQTARLDPADPRSPGFAEILDELRRMRMPAYVEVEPETNAVTRLLIPLVVRVENIRESETADILVDLEISHTRHVLRRENPDFGEIIDALQAAREQREWVAVTETDDHEIIDVRPYRPPPAEPPQIEPRERRSFFSWLWDWLRAWLCRLLGWFCCVSARKAEEMFALVNAQTCDPLTVPAPCIPFRYPDDGCWGRAHEMCRLMIAASVKPRKVWIYGSLHVSTKNNPNCEVFWGWHVAPTLCIRRRFWHVEDQVIDPSLFTGPVSKPTWKGVQGDPNAQLVDTDASVFYRSFNGSTTTDPNYAQTAQVLALYRLQLKNRSLQVGPPPYANCP